MVESNAKGAAAFGAGYQTESRPVRRLASLLAEHAPARIDWLKVDVEGAEADVLAGNDWARFRPRVVLVEAIAPGTMEPTHEAWEPILTGAGYAFAFFDGLNRFYLSEDARDLAGRMPFEYQDWGTVRHLWDHGRAPERFEHPDHALASALRGLDMASLPLVEPATLFEFLVKNVDPAELSEPATGDALDRFCRLWLGSEPHRFDVMAHVDRPLVEGLRAIAASDWFRAALGRIAAPYDGGFLQD